MEQEYINNTDSLPDLTVNQLDPSFMSEENLKKAIELNSSLMYLDTPFDPEQELGLIKKLSTVQEKENALIKYKYRLAEQRLGFSKLQESLLKIITNYSPLKTEEDKEE